MKDFIEILLYIVIGIWLLGLLVRILFPYLLKYLMKYLFKKANSSQQNTNAPYDSTSSTFNTIKKTSYSKKEKVGEYIDFEEID